MHARQIHTGSHRLLTGNREGIGPTVRIPGVRHRRLRKFDPPKKPGLGVAAIARLADVSPKSGNPIVLNKEEGA